MASTRSPFEVPVEDFANKKNENKSIEEEFLDMTHDSDVKTSFEDESLENSEK